MNLNQPTPTTSKPTKNSFRSSLRRQVLKTACIACATTATGVQAETTILDIILDLPDLILQPNQGGQTFDIRLFNVGVPIALTGVQLELAVEIGGPPGGGDIGPKFEGGSVVPPGSLFGSVPNNGDFGLGVFAQAPQVFQGKTSTAGVDAILGTLPLGGDGILLATITFDTTGISPGIYDWTALHSPNGATYFTGLGTDPVIFTETLDGTLTVVPEPAHCAAALGLGLLAFGAWRRSRS